MKFGKPRANRSRPDMDALDVLTSLSRLADGLRSGLDGAAATRIAQAAQEVLGASAVAVTNDRAVLGTAGEPPEEIQRWHATVEQNTGAVLDRRRTSQPTLYQIIVEGRRVDVAVAVLTSDAVPIGTVHVVSFEGNARLGELREFSSIVSSQLQLAELDNSRAYAAESELRALRAQISPHFLHNALTAIAGLVHTDPDRARSLIATLADFLRTSFRTETALITVSEELLLIESYLELEQARFGERFAVTLNIAPEALPVKLPFLSIQPLVENAIRHGLETRPGQGKLSIVAEDAGPEIAIHIEDDGLGIDPAKLHAALSGEDVTTHVGILAVDTRLRSRFGPEYGLTISTGANAGTKVTVRIPKYSPA